MGEVIKCKLIKFHERSPFGSLYNCFIMADRIGFCQSVEHLRNWLGVAMMEMWYDFPDADQSKIEFHVIDFDMNDGEKIRGRIAISTSIYTSSEPPKEYPHISELTGVPESFVDNPELDEYQRKAEQYNCMMAQDDNSCNGIEENITNPRSSCFDCPMRTSS